MNNALPIEHPSALHDLLTVVVVTQDRPAYLRRVLQHYASLPCRTVVLDFSAEAYAFQGEFGDTFDYLHLAQHAATKMTRGLAHGLAHVTTPYTVIAADSDFIVHAALADAVQFLQDQPQYGLCHGYSLMFEPLASSVNFLRRDKKVCEDYAAEAPQDRLLAYFQQYIPAFNAVTRTALLQDAYAVLPEQMKGHWHEIAHAAYLLLRAKARILPIPYAVRELEPQGATDNLDLYQALSRLDAGSLAEREAFAAFMAQVLADIDGSDPVRARHVMIEAFAAMADGLRTGASLGLEKIIESTWNEPFLGPQRVFEPRQYVEMPFYNQAFFDTLTDYEFLIHALPAGRLQLQQLEGVWVKQEALLVGHENDVPDTVSTRLWEAMALNPFNRQVVNNLTQVLIAQGQEDDADEMVLWQDRLGAMPAYDSLEVLSGMPSGRLLNWLDGRRPTADRVAEITARVAAEQGGPQFGLLLLDLEDDMNKLQATLDSLVEGVCRSFRIVVFTTGMPPAATTLSNTLHFVKVTRSNYVDKLNQIARQLACDWLMLAQVGDTFTPAGLTRASLELMGADQVRAVSADEIQRQSNGALVDVFRPGFNLDLLQSLPAQMARHWLIRRDVFLEAGGYSADFIDALEYDLVLRIIETGGLAWLAHLDEPLLVCDAPAVEENSHERLTLIRHLGTRGYKALVTSAQPGTWQVDYRHSHRPQVSIIVHGAGDLSLLQRCLTSITQRTRYTAYDILVAAAPGWPSATLDWLATQEKPGSRVRVIRDAQQQDAALINQVAQQAKGEYLVLFAANGEVINPNWLGSLLNHALRPEVGVVGAKLIDRAGKVTQAGLILGMNGGVGSAFVGQAKDAPGYLQRLVVEQNYSAVSDVCMMVRKALFEDAGGLDTEQFGEAFSDIDLCLKLGQAGYLTVWTPLVHVVHPGTLPDAPAALAALKHKWASVFEHDLAYNKNLALSGQGFTLSNDASVNWAQLLA
ncbi:TIGR00180 family glycosyltransferase [Pseudomonas huanghezhanensis]|uniref:TIGR00180 family glycosyltransferase n=1 Tax=Pseudomonas huanghezhanensis TaxID=3002903 RepID=UPI002285CFD3|nr:TIGR00180 family glycosyltransferase [Pseudomonas sp. BSw22131]